MKISPTQVVSVALGISLFCFTSCDRKVKDTSAENSVLNAKKGNEKPEFSETKPSLEALDSNRLRLACLGMSAFEEGALTGEKEILAEADARELSAEYGLREVRFYSEVLNSGVQESSAGSLTSFEKVKEKNPTISPRVLCQSHPNAEAGFAQATYPGILQFPSGLMTKILQIRHNVKNTEYKVSGNFRPTLNAESKSFRISSGHELGPATQYRIFQTRDESLRIRFRSLEVSKAATDVQLRLDGEAFYEKISL